MGAVESFCGLRDNKTAKEGTPRTESTRGQASRGLTVATWNLSAVNNNPFEYFINHDDERYAELMAGVESFVESPGDRDIPVSEVFLDTWFDELKGLMVSAGFEGTDAVEKYWKEDFRNRKIISGFLKDKSLGSKRLTSMPDRLTNTIRLAGDDSMPACRPTVINNYGGNWRRKHTESLATTEEWWENWKGFMFTNSLDIDGQSGVETIHPYKLLSKISRAKYPALTEDEEKVSVPLQVLCLAMFDALMVHMMVTLSSDGSWQQIKQSIVEAIYSGKDKNTLAIMGQSCAGCDVICLQECAASFKKQLTEALGEAYHILSPEDMDVSRNQNSLMLLRKEVFPAGAEAELTGDVMKALPENAPVDRGDICAFKASRRDGQAFLIVSFHGDTNGNATKPVVSATMKVLEGLPNGCEPLIGTDANVYLKKKDGMQHVDDFLDHCKSLGLRSCWPDDADLASCCTTCSARTYLQPQLNKAVKIAEKFSHGDVNPKDHILFRMDSFDMEGTFKDNTGERKYIEKECFPSLQFPSDHGIVGTVLKGKVTEEATAAEEKEEAEGAAVDEAAAAAKSAEEKEGKEAEVCPAKAEAEVGEEKVADEAAAGAKSAEEKEEATRLAKAKAEAAEEKAAAERGAAGWAAAQKALQEKAESEEKTAEEAAVKKAEEERLETDKAAAAAAAALKEAEEKADAQQKAAEEDAQKKAAAEKAEVERKAAEEAALKKAEEERLEAERKAGEEAANAAAAAARPNTVCRMSRRTGSSRVVYRRQQYEDFVV